MWRHAQSPLALTEGKNKSSFPDSSVKLAIPVMLSSTHSSGSGSTSHPLLKTRMESSEHLESKRISIHNKMLVLKDSLVILQFAVTQNGSPPFCPTRTIRFAYAWNGKHSVTCPLSCDVCIPLSSHGTYLKPQTDVFTEIDIFNGRRRVNNVLRYKKP